MKNKEDFTSNLMVFLICLMSIPSLVIIAIMYLYPCNIIPFEKLYAKLHDDPFLAKFYNLTGLMAMLLLFPITYIFIENVIAQIRNIKIRRTKNEMQTPHQ